MLRIAIVLLAVTSITQGFDAHARPLRIIHTNDLHSYMEQGDFARTGGYAAVKAKLDELKVESVRTGIETLVLDAGDFSEGNPLFLAGEGRESWKIIDEMGYDAITLGNHDWLIGLPLIDAILSEIQPKTPFLSANLVPADNAPLPPSVKRYVLPSIQVERVGVKIGILGLSTDQQFYTWRLQNGDIAPPDKVAQEQLPALRAQNDFVIALTHLGVDADVDLVKKVDGIDLVVGGHSHTALEKPIYSVTESSGRRVPIVQAGQHGNYVGDLWVDLEPGKPLRILKYRLIPVQQGGPSGSENPEIEHRVEQIREEFNSRYGGKAWLDEVVGYSSIPLEPPHAHPTDWGRFVTGAMLDAAEADMALDAGAFYGDALPPGPITRETIMRAYPRVFDPARATGWNVWVVRSPGWLIKIGIEKSLTAGQALSTAGLEFKKGRLPTGGVWIWDLKIRGQYVNPLKMYRVAVPEGFGRGALEISHYLNVFFHPRDLGIPIWQAVEDKIRREGGVNPPPHAPDLPEFEAPSIPSEAMPLDPG